MKNNACIPEIVQIVYKYNFIIIVNCRKLFKLLLYKHDAWIAKFFEFIPDRVSWKLVNSKSGKYNFTSKVFKLIQNFCYTSVAGNSVSSTGARNDVFRDKLLKTIITRKILKF